MAEKKRNYRMEYDRYQGTPEQIANRSARNKARRLMEKAGKVHKGDGMDVDHKVPIDLGGSKLDPKNLRVQTKSANRSFKRTSDGSPKK
jgi:hypothetical protein